MIRRLQWWCILLFHFFCVTLTCTNTGNHLQHCQVDALSTFPLPRRRAAAALDQRRFLVDQQSSSIEVCETINKEKGWFRKWLDGQQPKGVRKDRILAMIQNNNNRDNFTLVLTGATGGMGTALCEALLDLEKEDKNFQCHLVAIDRDLQGLKEWQERIGWESSRIHLVPADFNDLESVAQAANVISTSVSHVDVLVNNAGISYMLDDDQLDAIRPSRQGYDALFQINYLSHFLLTKAILPKLQSKSGSDHAPLSSSRIVQVASGFHWGADGASLLASPPLPNTDTASKEEQMASRGPPASWGTRQEPRHLSLSYPNSKLAQIWHAAECNRRNDFSGSTNNRSVRALCACPSWAATNIGSNDEGFTNLLDWCAYPTRPFVESASASPSSAEEYLAGPAISSLLNAIFLPEHEIPGGVWKGEQFVGNTNLIDILTPKFGNRNHPIFSKWFNTNLLPRIDATKLLAGVILVLQRWFFKDLFFPKLSDEASNPEYHNSLYDWSDAAVTDFLPVAMPETGAVLPESQ